MEYLPIAFLAGILTILAPCILPLLPIIIGGSLTEKSIKRPVIITASLAGSIVLFTLLLKASTALVEIPDTFWKYFSATIVFIFAVTLLFPHFWEKLSSTDAFGEFFKKRAAKLSQKNTILSSVLLGMALGPIFASCSPTYFLILGTVLPVNFFVGFVNLVAYALGLSIVMFLVAFAGQKMMRRLSSIANPEGWFKKVLGVVFFIVALGIATGYDKKVETYLLEKGPFNITNFEQEILDTIDENKMGERILPDNASKNVSSDASLLTLSYPAPELEGLENWINSAGYASLDELKGKVVIIDFWTYSCINCIRTLPSLQALHEKYADDGLVILGIHAPEFAFERKIENVKNAVDEYGLTYPVVQDNDFATWRNYNNGYWPAKYIIDAQGNVRYTHFGEGAYEETEKVVQELLNVKDELVLEDVRKARYAKTPETYLGTARRSEQYQESAEVLNQNDWTLIGDWSEDDEKISTSMSSAKIRINTFASSVNLVLGGDAELTVFVDGELYTSLTVDEHKLYTLFESPEEAQERVIEIEVVNGNVEAYAFTFG